MGTSYAEVTTALRTAYDAAAADRDGRGKADWKQTERAAFLERIRAAGARRLLELGAGPGTDGLFFASSGLEVVATDLSPEMVARCRAKGLDAHVRDFLGLDFGPDFDAAYALNSLLHVPDADLPRALERVRAALRPGGLFFLGVYGGTDSEGVADWDFHDPPRFFSFRGDERIQEFARRYFEIVDFHTVGVDDHRFQSLTLRKDTP